jgi:hypothetical protein
MPLNTVQTYVKGLLNELAVPFYEVPLTAYIQPPSPGSLTGPTAYIWGSVWNESRQTAPRRLPTASVGTGGFKKVIYQVDIYVKCPDASDYAYSDNAFPSVLDAVSQALNTTTMPITLTDPTTGLVSQIISVGEVISGDYSPVHVLDDQRYVIYEALLRAQVEEVISY